MKLEFRQTVTCNHLTLARVCGKLSTGSSHCPGAENMWPGFDRWTATQNARCATACAPGTGRRAALPADCRELEQLAAKKGWTLLKAVKNLNFPLAFCRIRAIIVRQSFPRPLDGVADIEGCDGHIH